MRCTPINFHGVILDACQTLDGRKWVTLSSLAKGLGVHRQTTKNWLGRKNAPTVDTVDVRVGLKGNSRATAYPLPTAIDYLLYLITRKNQQAIALVAHYMGENIDAYVTAELSRA